MNPEAQRIAILKALGWDFHEGRTLWIHGRPPPVEAYADLLNDLNACHKFEKTLTDEEYDKFTEELVNITGYVGELRVVFRNCVRATAAQRAEAFLRTLNLWKDDEPPRSTPL